MKKLASLILLTLTLTNCNTTKEKVEITPETRTRIEMKTDVGIMLIELYNETPKHRDNFIKLTNEKVFDSVIFHRVIKGFVVQGGNPMTKPTPPDSLQLEALNYKVDAEFPENLFHKRGALGAARDGNLQRASSSTQFYFVQGVLQNDSLLNAAQKIINERLAQHYFKNDTLNKPLIDTLNEALEKRNWDAYKNLNDSISKLASSYTNFEKYSIPEAHWNTYKTIGGTPRLDRNYTVFGEIIQGLEVMDSIAALATNDRDQPLNDVRIHTVKILN